MSKAQERLKFLTSLLSEIIDKIIDEETLLETCKSEKYKIDRGLLLLSFNKDYLKNDAKIVNIDAFRSASIDHNKVAKKAAQLELAIKKINLNLEALYNKENFILDEIDLIKGVIDKESRVIPFDPSKRRSK